MGGGFGNYLYVTTIGGLRCRDVGGCRWLRPPRAHICVWPIMVVMYGVAKQKIIKKPLVGHVYGGGCWQCQYSVVSHQTVYEKKAQRRKSSWTQSVDIGGLQCRLAGEYTIIWCTGMSCWRMPTARRGKDDYGSGVRPTATTEPWI